jgi:hypothetical protein
LVVVAETGEERLAEAAALDGLQEARGDDLVGVVSSVKGCMD